MIVFFPMGNQMNSDVNITAAFQHPAHGNRAPELQAD
jgi:hypothetical protein